MIDLFIINIHSILLIEHTIKTGHCVGSGFHKWITQPWSLSSGNLWSYVCGAWVRQSYRLSTGGTNPGLGGRWSRWVQMLICSVTYFYPLVKNKGRREEFGLFTKLYIFMLFTVVWPGKLMTMDFSKSGDIRVQRSKAALLDFSSEELRGGSTEFWDRSCLGQGCW